MLLCKSFWRVGGAGWFSCKAVAFPGGYPQEAPAPGLAGPRHDSHSLLPLTWLPPIPINKGMTNPARALMARLHGQHRFIQLIHAAFGSHGVEAAAEPLYITYTNRSKPEAREVAGTVQHAHRVVMRRALSWGTARPARAALVGSRPRG